MELEIEPRCTMEIIAPSGEDFLGQSLRIATNFRVGVAIYPGFHAGTGKLLPPCCLQDAPSRNRFGVSVCSLCNSPLPRQRDMWLNLSNVDIIKAHLESYALETLGPILNIMAVERFMAVVEPFVGDGAAPWPTRRADFKILTEMPRVRAFD